MREGILRGRGPTLDSLERPSAFQYERLGSLGRSLRSCPIERGLLAAPLACRIGALPSLGTDLRWGTSTLTRSGPIGVWMRARLAHSVDPLVRSLSSEAQAQPPVAYKIPGSFHSGQSLTWPRALRLNRPMPSFSSVSNETPMRAASAHGSHSFASQPGSSARRRHLSRPRVPRLVGS